MAIHSACFPSVSSNTQMEKNGYRISLSRQLTCSGLDIPICSSMGLDTCSMLITSLRRYSVQPNVSSLARSRELTEAILSGRLLKPVVRHVVT